GGPVAEKLLHERPAGRRRRPAADGDPAEASRARRPATYRPAMSLAVPVQRRPAYGWHLSSRWGLSALVLGAMSFHLALCFINANVAGVNNVHVMAFEVAIVSVALLASY